MRIGSGLEVHGQDALMDPQSPGRVAGCWVAGSEVGGCWSGDLGQLAAQLLLIDSIPWPEKRGQTFLSVQPSFPTQHSSTVLGGGCVCTYACVCARAGGGREK